MNVQPPMDPAEARARTRYMALNAVRIGAIAIAVAGFAGAQGVVPLPYPVSVVAAIGGIFAFFFAPPLMVKRWKSADRSRGE
jgi:uncharacterized membrane protein YhaH (DUF805 family)